MILRGMKGDVEVRDMFAGVDRVPRPGEAAGAWSFSGRNVSFDTASGIPAVMACIRLIAETAASKSYHMDSVGASMSWHEG